MRPTFTWLTALLALPACVACATTGATFRSGVGDALLEHPPYYAGAPAAAVGADTSRIGHLPVVYQPGAAQASIFDPKYGPGTPVGALLNEMNAYLDTLTAGTSVRLAEGGRVSAVTHAATRVPPDVRFGCLTASGVPGEDCAERGDSALGRAGQTMRLAVGRPSAEWTSWMAELTAERAVGRVLLLTLEVGFYLPRQTGLRGDKSVELGTANVQRLPWLTSLETPVAVLQLTGALVGRDGQAIRIGAEGFLAKRTRLSISALGAQELLSSEDVDAARSLRRDDLPGQPLAWREAMRQLVLQVTGRRDGTKR